MQEQNKERILQYCIQFKKLLEQDAAIFRENKIASLADSNVEKNEVLTQLANLISQTTPANTGEISAFEEVEKEIRELTAINQNVIINNLGRLKCLWASFVDKTSTQVTLYDNKGKTP